MLPADVLANLRAPSDWHGATDDAQLKDWIANNPIPVARAKVSGRLFHGTLVFVRLNFQQQGLPDSAVSLADVQTAVSYAALAAVPISRYAWQYGPNSVDVSPDVIPFNAAVTGGSFTGAQFEGWVEQCAQLARSRHIANPCIVILHNRALPNAPQFLNERNSFHSRTAHGTPYCYCLVFGEQLSVADNNHTINGRPNEKVYAHMLSHEIAEMVVDPDVDGSNPEVCDACAGNCSNDQFNLFDQNAVFLGGTNDTAAASGFAFFINSVVSATVALDGNSCVTGADAKSACIYPPPFVSGELLAYGDAATPGNVSNPMVVGLGGWLQFSSLFTGANLSGAHRIYAVDQTGRLLSYGDAGTLGNVSSPDIVGFGGWKQFKYLFAGTNLAGENRIYAVNSNGQLLSYGDAGTSGNVSSPVVVGFGGWQQFKFLFAGPNLAGENRIYAVNANGELLSYGDAGSPGNVSSPVVVGFGGWQQFKFLFTGRNLAGENRIYAVNANGELLSYGDAGTPGNVSAPMVVGFGGWLQFKFLCGGRNAAGQDRIYAVVA